MQILNIKYTWQQCSVSSELYWTCLSCTTVLIWIWIWNTVDKLAIWGITLTLVKTEAQSFNALFSYLTNVMTMRWLQRQCQRSSRGKLDTIPQHTIDVYAYFLLTISPLIIGSPGHDLDLDHISSKTVDASTKHPIQFKLPSFNILWRENGPKTRYSTSILNGWPQNLISSSLSLTMPN